MPRQVPIARITIDRPQGRNQTMLAMWLRTHANVLQQKGDQYALEGFRGRYFDTPVGPAIATLKVNAAGALSGVTRARIAKWMRSRATWLEKHGQFHDRRWFTQVFSL